MPALFFVFLQTWSVVRGERGYISATVRTVNCETDLDLNQHGADPVTWRPVEARAGYYQSSFSPGQHSATTIIVKYSEQTQERPEPPQKKYLQYNFSLNLNNFLVLLKHQVGLLRRDLASLVGSV